MNRLCDLIHPRTRTRTLRENILILLPPYSRFFQILFLFLISLPGPLFAVQLPLSTNPQDPCKESIQERSQERLRFEQQAPRFAGSKLGEHWYQYLQLKNKFEQTKCMDYLCLSLPQYLESLAQATSPSFKRKSSVDPSMNTLLSMFDEVSLARENCLAKMQESSILKAEEKQHIQSLPTDLEFTKLNLLERKKRFIPGIKRLVLVFRLPPSS